MMTPIELERHFQKIMQAFENQPQEEVVQIDLRLLEQLGLLGDAGDEPDPLTHEFHVLETPDKLTLFNETFAIWIVPQLVDQEPTTVALIGLIKGDQVELELAFTASGVYNSSKMVLQVLEKLLLEIRENEDLIGRMEKLV